MNLRMAQVEDLLIRQGEQINALSDSVEDLSNRVRHMSVLSSRSPGPETIVEAREDSAPSGTDQSILRVPVTPEDVQTALKNAGYYLGAIDGKLGSGSMRAIKEFQSDHDLVSDGIIGKKTWTQLKNYL